MFFNGFGLFGRSGKTKAGRAGTGARTAKSGAKNTSRSAGAPVNQVNQTKTSRASGAKKSFSLRELFALPSLDMAALTDRAAFYLTLAAWGVLILVIYLVASIFTSWTGTLGGAARSAILSRYGGASLVVLFFIGYLAVSVIAHRRIPKFFGQIAGTMLLFLCAAFMLGLFDLGMPGVLWMGFLYPGALGKGLAGWAFENIGPLGTTLVGVAAISLAMICFGYTTPFWVIYEGIFSFFERLGRGRRGDKGAKASKRAERHAAGAAVGEFLDDDEGDMEEGESFDEPFADDFDDFGEYEDGQSEQSGQSGQKMPPNVQSINGTHLYVSEPEEERAARQARALASGAKSPNLPSPVAVTAVDEIESGDVDAPLGQFPPPVELYGPEQDDDGGITQEMARPWGERIIDSLAQFGIEAELAEILLGPTVIQFRIQPLPGVKVNKIVALSNDLAMALAVASLRVEAPIPGKPYVGIEIPNPKRRGITLRTMVEDETFQETEKTLPLPMGVTINGDPLVIGMEEMPHLLVAGTTGSGKSVFVNGCIVGLCSMRKPDELKMVLVDPKRVEMAVYEKLPHLLTPPVTDPKKAVHVLGWAVREMERRYSNCASVKVRNLASYNELMLPKDRLPHIVIVVDELADLMMTAAKEVEEYICRLAQMARAVGIHLMLATQRPSVNVITGLIKANVPARVAFTLPSMMDSRTILDTGGAEKLLGKGDMLFTSTQNPKPLRIQSPWIDEQSIARWIDYLIHMFGEPDFTDIEEQGSAPVGFEEGGGSFDDALFPDAVKAVVSSGMASASGLQRRLRVGFTRAGRLVDMMESAGIIGPADGARPREILVDEDEAEAILERLGSV